MKRILCTCGHNIRGETDDELWVNAQAHIESVHPEMIGKVSRDELLEAAEQE